MKNQAKQGLSSEASFLLKVGQIINQKYKILEEAGIGTYAKVFKIQDMETSQLLALKLVNFNRYEQKYKNDKLKVLKRAFNSEVKNLYEMKSNYVVKFRELLQLKQQKKAKMIVMEYCDGPKLSLYVQPTSAQDEEIKEHEALEIISHIIAGVYALHSKNIIHRDLHAGNIMRKGNKWVIIDLGFSKIIQFKQKVEKQTFCGCELTMAPQIIKSTRKYGARADIWSIGVLLFYILTQQHPFEIRSKIKQQDIVTNYIKETLKSQFDLENNDSKLKSAGRSQKIIQFLKDILQFDQDKRMNIFQLARHPIFKQYDIDVTKLIIDDFESNYGHRDIQQINQENIEQKMNELSIIPEMSEQDSQVSNDRAQNQQRAYLPSLMISQNQIIKIEQKNKKTHLEYFEEYLQMCDKEIEWKISHNQAISKEL